MNYKVSVVILKNNNAFQVKILRSPHPQELPMPPVHWLKT